MRKLTNDEIESLKTPYGGWSPRIIEALGLKLDRGWPKRMKQGKFTEEQIKAAKDCSDQLSLNQPYIVRRTALNHLGFKDYGEYLASPLWAKIRKMVLRRDNCHCIVCGGLATQVHHRRYDRQTLAGEQIRHLYSACSDCHEAAERTPDGRRRGLRAANATLVKPRKHKTWARKLRMIDRRLFSKKVRPEERKGARRKPSTVEAGVEDAYPSPVNNAQAASA